MLKMEALARRGCSKEDESTGKRGSSKMDELKVKKEKRKLTICVMA